MSWQVDEAAQAVKGKISLRPEVAIVLGSGLGRLVERVSDQTVISYREIPHFPLSTAPGHAGRLLVGRLAGQPVAVLAGRAHLYEGYAADQVVLPVRVLHALGAKTLIITNAAGGVNYQFQPGTLMVITDHINLSGRNPLVGPNETALGPRFPDMSTAYSARLRELARRAAAAVGVPVVEGVYLGLLGPSYETPAEIRMARLLGADAVGMSTVMEVIAAKHAGMQALGISCITNMAAGILPRALSEEEVMATANQVSDEFIRLIEAIVGRLEEAT